MLFLFFMIFSIEHELRSKTVGVNLVLRLNTRLRWVWEFPRALCRLECSSSVNSNDFFLKVKKRSRVKIV